MGHADFKEGIPRALLEVSSALLSLRDALVELTLLLHELQFEIDREERNNAETAFRQLLEKMRSGPDDVSGPP